MDKKVINNSVSPQIAVVILNWNGLQDTIECLKTVLISDYEAFDVIVVDNGSTDQSAEEIPKQFPNVMFIKTGLNLGWAGGNNVGIKHAFDKGIYDYIFLLNNDTTIEKNCLTMLVKASKKNKNALMHPAIYYYDAPTVPQIDPSYGLDKTMITEVMPLKAAYGAALFLATTDVKKIGLIDEKFFLQLEETDFAIRAKAFNITPMCAVQARILHKESRAFGGRVTPVKTYYIIRNSLLLLYKHRGMSDGYITNLKKLLWTINGLASKAQNTQNNWRFSDLVWIMSADPTARAVRYGVTDFLMKNFGSISINKLKKLQRSNATALVKTQ